MRLHSATVSASAQFNIVPLPKQITENGTSFDDCKWNTKIYYEQGLKAQAELLNAASFLATGFDFEMIQSKPGIQNGIILKFDKSLAANKEGYRLSVKNNAVVLSGGTAAGVFYGTQTLLQMLPAAIHDKTRQKAVTWKIRGAEIEDAPLWGWRGMMLDVSRYFFSKDYVLKFIDMMSCV